ncbi:2-oxoacid:acceptor oxidoreductase subunit alpha [Thermovenabulum sp.]|uniref:2-oxoacid:acceptor oxidoreductase subunit alpha n=2 Tax=Thermovenabulum sp. TaxID=3100335 RepID=UPI003C7E8D46
MHEDIKFLQGNEACVEGALKAGARFYAGYPITPSSEIAELASIRLPSEGGVFIQMEDEIASMAALVGASFAGAKAFTATSGPGFSLMQENIGLAIMTEAPCVVINVQRSGPSTGLATKPAQADVMQARWGTHGDHAAIVLAPATVQECYDLIIYAFNFAEKYRTPVIFLSDEIVGHMREKVVLHSNIPIVQRRMPNIDPEKYRPYEPEKTGVPPLAYFGSEYTFHASSSMHDETGFPNNSPQNAEKVIKRLYNKIYQNKEDIIITKEFYTEDAEILLISFGASARSSREAVNILRKQGKKAGLLQLNTLWPFPDEKVKNLADKARIVIVPEMNLGQIIGEVQRVLNNGIPVVGVNKVNSEIITPLEIIEKIKEVI